MKRGHGPHTTGERPLQLVGLSAVNRPVSFVPRGKMLNTTWTLSVGSTVDVTGRQRLRSSDVTTLVVPSTSALHDLYVIIGVIIIAFYLHFQSCFIVVFV